MAEIDRKERSRVCSPPERGLQLGVRMETDGRPRSDGGVLKQRINRVRAAHVGALNTPISVVAAAVQHARSAVGCATSFDQMVAHHIASNNAQQFMSQQRCVARRQVG